MIEFNATMRVTRIEIWTVTAKDEAEAREKIRAMDADVETDETGGETTDWKISSIEAVHGNGA